MSLVITFSSGIKSRRWSNLFSIKVDRSNGVLIIWVTPQSTKEIPLIGVTDITIDSE